jgi:predicted HAD superfamily Cof-like phosphohydrolase
MVLSRAQEALSQFYREFELPAGSGPVRLQPARVHLLANWVVEEANELVAAETIESQADALADIIYFAIGGFVELGLDASSVFSIVHEANMKRKGPGGMIYRNDVGKIVKPPGWVSPLSGIRALVVGSKRAPDR